MINHIKQAHYFILLLLFCRRVRQILVEVAFSLYEIFPARRAVSTLISSLFVSSESSNLDRPKIYDASLLPLFYSKLSNTLGPRFMVYRLYLDLIYSPVIDISFFLLD